MHRIKRKDDTAFVRFFSSFGVGIAKEKSTSNLLKQCRFNVKSPLLSDTLDL